MVAWRRHRSGRGRGGERHLRRPGAADAGTDPRPLDVHTRESRGRRLADAACRSRGGTVPGDGHPVAPASGGPGAGPLPGPAAPGAIPRAADRGGRWGEAGSDAASEGLSGAGATHVAFTLADARDQILARAATAVPVTAAPRGLSRTAIPGTPPVLRMRTSGLADVLAHTPRPRPRSRDTRSGRSSAGDLPIGEPASITLSISAAPSSTSATAQNQNNSTMTPPSAPSDWL